MNRFCCAVVCCLLLAVAGPVEAQVPKLTYISPTAVPPGQTVDVADLPPEMRDSSQQAVATDWLAGLATEVDRLLAANEHQIHEKLTNCFERILISRALAHTGGRRIEAAVALGIGRNTITRKIQELGMDGARAEEPERAAG